MLLVGTSTKRGRSFVPYQVVGGVMGAHLYLPAPRRAGTSDAVLQTQEWLEGPYRLGASGSCSTQRNLAVRGIPLQKPQAGNLRGLREDLARGVS